MNSQTTRRLLLWAALSLALSGAFFRDFWTSLPRLLSPDYIFGQFNATPWGVLALCLTFLWLKRKEIDLRGPRNDWLFVLVGLALVVGAVLTPSSEKFLTFRVLTAFLGVFVIIFGRAARIPAILLAVYAFAVFFPPFVERFAEEAYASTAIAPVMGLMTAAGYPIANDGQWVHLSGSSGQAITVAITAACAGPSTMAVFIALFALMTLDVPLPPRRAAALFFFGVLGTWFQNLWRLLLLLLVAYYRGEDAMWAIHRSSIYIIFPLWYLLFAYIYFRQLPVSSRKSLAGSPLSTADCRLPTNLYDAK